MTSNSSKKKFILILVCPETTRSPAAPEPGDLSKKSLYLEKFII